MTTLAVAEASAVLAAGARAVLVREGFSVWTAACLDELVAQAAACPPAVAVVDRSLPPDGGARAMALLAERARTRTVAWSFDPTPEDVLAAVAAGALGYLPKHVAPAELVAAVRRVSAGEVALGHDVAGLLVAGVQQAYGSRLARASLLSPREQRVLELVSEGLRNREIAAALAISEFTVKRHVQNILRKLELPSRRAAAAFHAEHAAGAREVAA